MYNHTQYSSNNIENWLDRSSTPCTATLASWAAVTPVCALSLISQGQEVPDVQIDVPMRHLGGVLRDEQLVPALLGEQGAGGQI